MLKIGYQGGNSLGNWVVPLPTTESPGRRGFPMDGGLVSAESYNLKSFFNMIKNKDFVSKSWKGVVVHVMCLIGEQAASTWNPIISPWPSPPTILSPGWMNIIVTFHIQIGVYWIYWSVFTIQAYDNFLQRMDIVEMAICFGRIKQKTSPRNYPRYVTTYTLWFRGSMNEWMSM